MRQHPRRRSARCISALRSSRTRRRFIPMEPSQGALLLLEGFPGLPRGPLMGWMASSSASALRLSCTLAADSAKQPMAAPRGLRPGGVCCPPSLCPWDSDPSVPPFLGPHAAGVERRPTPVLQLLEHPRSAPLAQPSPARCPLHPNTSAGSRPRQAMPVLSTKMMPRRHARSSRGGRPLPLRFYRSSSVSGATQRLRWFTGTSSRCRAPRWRIRGWPFPAWTRVSS